MKRKKVVLPEFVCMGPYSKSAPVLFEANKVKNNLSEVLSKKGLKQLRISESEKFSHVSFFFNSQNKKPWPGEKHIIVPSPKVPSYDLKPEMSCYEETDTIIKELNSRHHYDFILMNFANTDLVSHSGKFPAAVKAVEAADDCLSRIVPTALEKGYTIFITADHGNCEYMRYPNGEACPSHTCNPVMFMTISKDTLKLRKGKTLGLKDIAPTILDVMKVKQPKEMTGKSLIKTP